MSTAFRFFSFLFGNFFAGLRLTNVHGIKCVEVPEDKKNSFCLYGSTQRKPGVINDKWMQGGLVYSHGRLTNIRGLNDNESANGCLVQMVSDIPLQVIKGKPTFIFGENNHYGMDLRFGTFLGQSAIFTMQAGDIVKVGFRKSLNETVFFLLEVKNGNLTCTPGEPSSPVPAQIKAPAPTPKPQPVPAKQPSPSSVKKMRGAFGSVVVTRTGQAATGLSIWWGQEGAAVICGDIKDRECTPVVCREGTQRSEFFRLENKNGKNVLHATSMTPLPEDEKTILVKIAGEGGSGLGQKIMHLPCLGKPELIAKGSVANGRDGFSESSLWLLVPKDGIKVETYDLESDTASEYFIVNDGGEILVCNNEEFSGLDKKWEEEKQQVAVKSTPPPASTPEPVVAPKPPTPPSNGKLTATKKPAAKQPEDRLDPEILAKLKASMKDGLKGTPEIQQPKREPATAPQK